MRTSRRFRVGCYTLLVGGLGLWLGSCSEPAGTPGPQRAAVGPPPARHAVHTEKLRAIMSRMGGRVAKEWPQEIADLRAAQEGADEQARFREAGAMAKNLAEAADLIPDAVADADMTPAEKQAFMVNVDQLRQQAEELQSVALAQDLAGMKATLSRIQTTCYGCHAQFREVAGPLQFGH